MNQAVRIVLEKAGEAISEILNMDAVSEPMTTTKVPEPTSAPVAPIARGLLLDSENLPWDVRIHASTKTFVKDGTWKLKRGTDPIVVAQVKTELRGAQTITAPPAPSIPASPVNPPVNPPAPEPVADTPSWAKLVADIQANGIASEIVLAACNKFNVSGLGELQDSPVLTPLVAKELGL